MGLTPLTHPRTLAANVHPLQRGRVANNAPVSPSPMNRDFQIRFAAGFLALLTIAAVTLAWINFRKAAQFVAPYDGVSWVERGGNVVADRVASNSRMSSPHVLTILTACSNLPGIASGRAYA